ncbi:TrmH family RNA methyltransferase [Candidatus Omnitrophota bacterium]
MFLYGRNSVFERLKRNPASIEKVYLHDNFSVPQIEQLIKTNNIVCQRLPFNQLSKIKPAPDTQGIIARVGNFKCPSFKDLLNCEPSRKLTLIFLDRIYDPQNLGAIIRTAACFGGFALVIPKFKACAVNDTVLHVASGGENHIAISMVSNLSNAIISAKKRGYWIMGACAQDDSENINRVEIPFPLGLILGSEGKGIRYGVDKHIDLRARIPMQGAALSFNVTIACAIFCHEISKSRIAITHKGCITGS